MVEAGQIWTTSGRTVRVLAADDQKIVIRDSYGWKRSLTEDELRNGFALLSSTGQSSARPRGVMARRALADVPPS